MSGYTSTQVQTLQSYINSATAALAAGNSALAQQYIIDYYSAQTGMRSYATDALNVINGQGTFGVTEMDPDFGTTGLVGRDCSV